VQPTEWRLAEGRSGTSWNDWRMLFLEQYDLLKLRISSEAKVVDHG
jgi:hypothetical protein